MAYAIVAQNPKMARELARHQAAEAKKRALDIRQARKEQGAGRYLVIDAGFPAIRYLIWDTKRGDNLRGPQLPGNPRHPWFSFKSKALKIAAARNREDSRSESLSYGVSCIDCLGWETACRCDS